ncbi:MAG: hypothetical protein EOO43_03785 [Flavobacterium sp.]|nr:MAG: hypothetical protein EOO43_03785 [Flavobacterium sp.]
MNTDAVISIVVCSVNQVLFESFEKNVSETIGCSYEMIRIENNKNPRGICEIYNEGLTKAAGTIICYCHEDILFETQDWGNELVTLLKVEEIGLIGVAGAVYKSKFPTSWVAVPSEYYRTNMKQMKADGTSFYSKILDEGSYSEVAVLDGCFVAGRKKVFLQHMWNQELLKGFHLYDLDICLKVRENYKLVVANNISITHFSEGNFGLDWLKASEQYHQINNGLLPVSVNKLSENEVNKLDYFGLYAFIDKLKQLRQPEIKKIKYIIKAILLFPFKRQNFMLIKNAFN